MAVVAAFRDAKPSQLTRPRRRLLTPDSSIWNALAVLGPTVAVAVLGYRRRWIGDDGLIITRTVREIVAGNGPVFSPGERAEASTSVLWTWLLALGTWLARVDPAQLAVYGGLVLTTAGFALALSGGGRIHELLRGEDAARGRRRLVLVPAGALVLLVVPPVCDYATSGLETGLGTFWTAVAWRVLVRSARPMARWQQTGSGAVLGLGELVRPDLVVVSVAFLAGAWWLQGRPDLRRSLLWLVAAGLLPAAYEVFRMGYYGLLVPLPAVTKEAGASEWGHGWRYARDFFDPYWLWAGLPLAALVLVAAVHRSRAPRDKIVVLVALPVVTGLVMAVYVVKVGGDWMHARMLLPALFVVLLPVLVVPLTRQTAAAGLALLLWAGAVASPLRPMYDPGLSYTRLDGDARRGAIALTGLQHPTTSAAVDRAFPAYVMAVNRAVAGHQPVLLIFGSTYGDDRLHPVPLGNPTRRAPVVVGSFLGVAGDAVPLDDMVVDQYGLAYPLAGHLALQRGIWPGHEKLISNAWVLADYAVPGGRPPGPQGSDVSLPAIAAARHALSCGVLRELRDSVRDPLTLARFWDNVTGAVGRTRLRIPRDPAQAERQFCSGR